jgi:hypothetical protein
MQPLINKASPLFEQLRHGDNKLRFVHLKTCGQQRPQHGSRTCT